MTRRKLPLTLAVVGVLIILAAIIAASVVRSSDTATLSLGERPEVPVVITEPGVLDAVDPEVTVRATAGEDEQVVLAVGRTEEVEAWLGSADHARITGLSSWQELRVEVVTGTDPDATATPQPTPTGDAAQEETTTPPADDDAEEQQTLPDPAGSDLWVAETVSTGTAELTWHDQPGRWTLVAATDGTGPAPEVELEWGRQVSTPWLVPGIVIGALLLVAGATMLVLDVLARREQRRRDDARARAADTGYGVSITDTDPGTGQRLTRRQIREMEREMALGERGDATAPDVPPAGPQETAPGARWAPDEAGEDRDDHSVPAAEHAPAPDEPAAAEDADAAAALPPEPAGEEDHAPVDDAPGEAGQDPPPEDAAAAPSDSGPEAPTPLSWRSVWGFGGATVEPDRHDHQDDQDDQEEQR